MSSRQWILFVLAILGWMCVSVAADPIELHARREVERRQLNDNSSTPITTSSTPIVIPTTSSIPTTNSITPSTSSIIDSSTSTPETSSSTTDSSSSSPSSTSSLASSTDPSLTSLSTSYSRSIRTFTTDIVTTINGQPTTIPQTYASTTFIPTTIIPGLQNDATPSGLTDNSKKIVIGVVVGVGGAALLAGIAVVLWRHFKRDRERELSNQNLTYFTDEPSTGPESVEEKTVAGPEYRSPQINTASNF